jgi:hypothetical protein
MRSLDELRTDKASGIIVGCVGIIMAGYGAFGLVIVKLQSLVIDFGGPIPVRPDGFDFAKMMRDMHTVWLTYMPFTVGGGILFAVCGLLIYRGSNHARRVAQLNAILGYAWGSGYSWSCSHLVERFFVPGVELSESSIEVLRIGMLIMSIIFNAAIPTALLFLLSRTKNQTIDAILC